MLKTISDNENRLSFKALDGITRCSLGHQALHVYKREFDSPYKLINVAQ